VIEPDLSVRCAKRKEFLESDDTFFGFRTVLVKMKQRVAELAAKMHEQFGSDKWVYLYGELAGGFFPGATHDESDTQPVQTGVWYSNDLIFYAFDIGIQTVKEKSKSVLHNEEPLLKETHFEFVDYEQALSLFREYNILHSEPLFVGPYHKCLEFKLGFRSTIPSKLGMPPLNDENKAEGVVVKPYREMTPASQRPMTKLKIVEFEERSDVYDQSTKAHNSSDSTPLNSALYEMYPLITENRYANTVSKTGPINGDSARANEVLEAFEQDVIEEMLEENSTLFDCLMGHEMKQLREQLRTLCKKCIIKSEKAQKKRLKRTKLVSAKNERGECSG